MATFEGQYHWYYEGKNGWWLYDVQTSMEIERQYQNKNRREPKTPIAMNRACLIEGKKKGNCPRFIDRFIKVGESFEARNRKCIAGKKTKAVHMFMVMVIVTRV